MDKICYNTINITYCDGFCIVLQAFNKVGYATIANYESWNPLAIEMVSYRINTIV